MILPILRNHIYDNHTQYICNELQISDCIETEDVTVRERISECFVEHKSVKKNNRFSCLLCKQSYITRTSINYHMKHHLKYTSRRGKTKCHPCTDCGKMVKTKKNHLHECNIQTFAFMESQQQKKGLEHPDKNQQEQDRLERDHGQQEQKYLKQQKLHQQELNNLKNEPDQHEDQHLEHQQKLKKEQEQQKENYGAEQEIKQEQQEEEEREMIKQDIYLQTKEQQNMDQVEEQQLSHHKKEEEEFDLHHTNIKVNGNSKNSSNPRNCEVYSAVPNMNSDELSSIVDSMHEKTGVGREWFFKICGKKSRDNRDSAEHVHKHIPGLLFSCSDCGFVAKCKATVRRHIAKKS